MTAAIASEPVKTNGRVPGSGVAEEELLTETLSRAMYSGSSRKLNSMVSLPVPVTLNENCVQTLLVVGSDWLYKGVPSQDALKSLGSSPTAFSQKLNE